MILTAEEKALGRPLREWCQSQLALAEPEATLCSSYLIWFRHPCLATSAASRAVLTGTFAMHLRQYYWELEGTPFAFIHRRGQCKRCDLVVRSGDGRFVVAEARPPEKGAVVVRVTPYGAVPQDQAAAQASR